MTTDINHLHDVIELRVSGRRCGRTTAACHLIAGALETGARSVAFIVPSWSRVPWARERLLEVLREHEWHGDTPRWKPDHDCCMFLGRFGECDLWGCDKCREASYCGPIMMARYGDDEYTANTPDPRVPEWEAKRRWDEMHNPASEPQADSETARSSEFRRGVEACIAAIECMTPRGDPPGMGVHRPLVQNHVADRIEASLRHLLDAPASEPQATREDSLRAAVEFLWAAYQSAFADRATLRNDTEGGIKEKLDCAYRTMCRVAGLDPLAATPAPVNTPPADEDAVERVARAIYAGYWGDYALGFDGESDALRAQCRRAARAAIAALGDPADKRSKP